MTHASSYRSDHSSRGTTRAKRAGFTLVELAVVIGMSAVLVAMLVGALTWARESARRVRCAANLKNMGDACQAFANANGGRFPMCYRMRDTANLAYPYYTPFVIPQPDKFSADADPSLWTIYGTSWDAWQQYGVNLATLSCPSSIRPARAQDLSSSKPEWGSVIWSDYMYVGGLTTTIIAGDPRTGPGYSSHSIPNWGAAVPAVTSSDSLLSTRVLAADMVFYSGGRTKGIDPAFQWDITGRWIINHPAQDRVYDTTLMPYQDSVMPDFQNILYGDGHVAALTRMDYRVPLNTKDAPQKTWNFSMIQADVTQPIGGYMYWGGSALTSTPATSGPPPAPQVPGGGSGPILSGPPPAPPEDLPTPPVAKPIGTSSPVVIPTE